MTFGSQQRPDIEGAIQVVQSVSRTSMMGGMWSAPEITRRPEPVIASERDSLEDWLDYHRDTLRLKCAGLSGKQLAQRSCEPSSLSLLGLVRHMSEVERSWFRRRFAAQTVDTLYCPDNDPDGDFDNVDPAMAETDFATFDTEIALAREVCVSHALEETFRTGRGNTLDLRWIYVHMIEEYARHNGHADLLRERIDGVTGD
jgi:Protein of unknown function (DUF664)